MEGENYAYNGDDQNYQQEYGENYQLQEQSYDPNGQQTQQSYGSAPITSTASAGSCLYLKIFFYRQIFWMIPNM